MLANTINYTYDGVGDVTQEQVVTGLTTALNYGYDGDSRLTAAAVAGGANPQSYAYSYDNDSELTGIAGGPATVTLGYDNDGRRICMTLPNGVIASYAYDLDSDLTSLIYGGGGSCSSPPSNLGNLAYAYDADGRVISESGSLAALNLPQSEGPNTYSSLNQIMNWNGTAATADLNGNLLTDPVSGASYAWDSRNQLASISGGPAGSFSAQYDAITRRYDQTTAFGGTTTYVHDKSAVAQSSNIGQSGPSGPGASNTYLTMPGTGEALAATITSGGTSSVYVPLTDALGSTLALVDSSGAVAAQYTYDPFGNVTASGQSLAYPYQFAGMALDPTGLYFDGSNYYDPALGRPLEGYGAPHAPGGGQGGGAGPPSSSSGGGLGGFNADLANSGVLVATSGAAGMAAAGYELVMYGVEAQAGPIGWAVAAVTAIVQAVLDLFGIDLFGGGGSRPTPPPMDYRFFHYPSGPFLGVPYAIMPNMLDSAAVEGATPFSSPFAAISDNPPSTSGNPYGGNLMKAQYIGRSPSASPNPQIKKAPPVPTPAPTPYPQCMARYFAGANAKYAELPGACVAGGISCLLTGLPIACIPGYVACLGGIFIEAKCYKQSEGHQ